RRGACKFRVKDYPASHVGCADANLLRGSDTLLSSCFLPPFIGDAFTRNGSSVGSERRGRLRPRCRKTGCCALAWLVRFPARAPQKSPHNCAVSRSRHLTLFPFE